MQMKIYNKGQVVIPVNIRKKYNINIGDYVNIIMEENCIKLLPVQKTRVVDKLFGILNKKDDQKEISENDIDKAVETGFLKGWNKE